MRRRAALALALSTIVPPAGCAPPPPAPPAPPPAPAPWPAAEDATPPPLRPAASFAPLADRRARSLALFAEAGRVIAHPRCTNCHPADGVPRQGLAQRPHEPRAVGGDDGHGPPGLPCASCHQAANTPLVGASLASVPGNPKWALAPAKMAWVGKSLGAICEQIKDPARNGGHDL
ncbi:MAG TPA: hypothetical protein VFS00_12300 [Polyangiaceae bacterium]|nr:hypothetical protein [Polyangiaceae bacterium]